MIADRVLDHLKHTKNDARSVALRLRGILPDVNANNGAGAVERACLESAIESAEKVVSLLEECTKGAEAPAEPAKPEEVTKEAEPIKKGK